MIRLRHKLFIYILRLFDQALLISVLLLTVDVVGRYHNTGSLPFLLKTHYNPRATVGLFLLVVLWIWAFNLLVHYETNRLKTLKSQLVDVTKATVAAAFLLLIVSTMFSYRRIGNEVILIFWGVTWSLGMASRLVLRQVLMLVRRSGYNFRHMIILGSNPRAYEMARRIEAQPELGYKLMGFISEHENDSGSNPPMGTKHQVIGHIHEMKSILEDSPVDEIIICIPILEQFSTICEAIRLAQELGVVVRLFPEEADAKILSRFQLERFEGNYVVTLFREQLLIQLLAKRLLDVFVSSALIVLLSPLLIGVALAVKFSSPGPILFIQNRVGMNKRSFKLFKFRSMFIDAEKRRKELVHLNEMDGPVFKIKNDPRVTPIGRIIRKTSIDELPQLFNVLTGHMSLVGPRPPLLEEVNRYDWLYRKRLSIKPGITCLWQISGRNEVTFKEWMEMDKYYIDNWSFWFDLEILFKTVPAVLFRKGAS